MDLNILIITTYSDEAQINLQKELIKSQVNINCEHIIIEGLNKVESQKEFHSTLIKNKNNFDYIIKLDADMVPVDELALSKLVQFAIDKKVDRLTMPVFDFFTNTFIMGIHIIKASKVPAIHNITENNTDGWIGEMSGERYFYTKCRYVNHAFNPSLEQSVRYGLHRGLKSKKDSLNGQWISLLLLYKNWNKNKIIEIGYAVLGSLYGLGIIETHRKIDWTYLDHNSYEFNELCDSIKMNFLNSDNLSSVDLEKISFIKIHYKIFKNMRHILYIYMKLYFNYLIIKK